MNQSRTVRLPIHIVKDINCCLRARRRLQQRNGHAPTIQELADHLQREAAEVERLLALHERVTLTANGRYEDGDGPVDRLHAKRSAEPSRCAQRDDVNDIVDRWVCELSAKQRTVVERRFGLHGCGRATLEQIGEEIGVTRERVRQIQLDALKNLREMLERHGISGESLLD